MELLMTMQALVIDRYPPPRGVAVRGLNVLVVEDDVADAHLIKRALADSPRVAHVDFASDGVEALALIDQGIAPPDLAIIDLKMPRMDGFRLLIELACRDEDRFPVVVLTSSTAK